MRQKNMRDKLKLREDYDKEATIYDKLRFGSRGGVYASDVEKQLVASRLEGKIILEIGTATGRFADLLPSLGYKYTGIDLSWRMLDYARRKSIGHGKEIDLLQMDVEAMSLRPHFDSILCIRTFHFLIDPTSALRNMRNALRKGGVCLTTFETDNPLRRTYLSFRSSKAEQRYYTRKEVELMLERTGFLVVESGPVLRLPVTLYRRCPGRFIKALSILDRLWPWAMHQYVLSQAR